MDEKLGKEAVATVAAEVQMSNPGGRSDSLEKSLGSFEQTDGQWMAERQGELQKANGSGKGQAGMTNQLQACQVTKLQGNNIITSQTKAG